MTNAETDLDELKALQREAAALRSERQQRQRDSSAAAAEGQEPAVSEKKTSTAEADSQVNAEPPAAAAPLQEATPESAATREDINIDFNAILKGMEDATRERPVLALLAALSLGIVVGQIFSRK